MATSLRRTLVRHTIGELFIKAEMFREDTNQGADRLVKACSMVKKYTSISPVFD